MFQNPAVKRDQVEAYNLDGEQIGKVWDLVTVESAMRCSLSEHHIVMNHVLGVETMGCCWRRCSRKGFPGQTLTLHPDIFFDLVILEFLVI